MKNLPNVKTIIDRQDMEQLAAMVLSGDGQYLIGAKSNQPEIQAFLDNVPAYMVRDEAIISRMIFFYCNHHNHFYRFRIKFDECILQPEKEVYEICNQHWTVVNLLLPKMIFRQISAHLYM